MFNFHRISVHQAKELIEGSDSTLIDIRDEASFSQQHIATAQFVDQGNVREFLDNGHKNRPLIVYCYHGNSSQSAAQFFFEQGFAEVYSMDGGFEEWRITFPDTLESRQEQD